MKLRTNQQGISPLIIVVSVLLLGLLGFAGWTVYNKNKKTDTKTTSSTAKTSDTPATPKKTVELTTVKPVSKIYQVDIPVSWVSGTCTDNPDLLFLAPTKDTLGKCQSEYFGTVSVTKSAGSTGHNKEYYTTNNEYTDVSFEPLAIDDFASYKVSYTQATANELGVPAVGTIITQYVIYDGSDTFTLSYSRTNADADLSVAFQDLAESFTKL